MHQPTSKGLRVAIYIITLIFLYFAGVTFFPEHVNEDAAKTITTYLQTVLIVIVGYYWGASSKHEQNETLEDDKGTEKVINTERLEVTKDIATDISKEKEKEKLNANA